MFAGIGLEEFPHVQKWLDRIYERPAVQKGLDVPEPNKLKALLADPKLAEEAIEEARKMMVSHKPS